MREPEKMDKRLEEEIGQILEERSGRLLTPRTRGHGTSLHGGGWRGAVAWRIWVKNMALVIGTMALFLLLVGLGPIGLRLLPLLIFVGIGVYAFNRVKRLPFR